MPVTPQSDPKMIAWPPSAIHGEYRVTAYGLDVPGMRWEVFVTLEEARVAGAAG